MSADAPKRCTVYLMPGVRCAKHEQHTGRHRSNNRF